MADQSRSPDADPSSAAVPEGGPTAATARYPGTPRWVKMSAIVVLVLILLVVVVAVAGGGQHGPMRHMPAGAPGAEVTARA
jgi:hypothetical protein